jgi:hypothetical protein
MDVKTFFDSLKVEQAGNRAILTATVPPGFVKKVFVEAPAEAVVPAVTAPPAKDLPAMKPPRKPASR